MALELTEKELRAEITRLEKLVRSGDATIVDANKLSTYRYQLDQIERVKYSRY